jgi:hypothetical protein
MEIFSIMENVSGRHCLYFRHGHCLIFENDKFDAHLRLTDREGSAEDRQLMEAVLREHHFQVRFHHEYHENYI